MLVDVTARIEQALRRHLPCSVVSGKWRALLKCLREFVGIGDDSLTADTLRPERTGMEGSFQVNLERFLKVAAHCRLRPLDVNLTSAS